MDIRKIKKLIEMLQDSDLTEIEVTEGEEAVRISRNSGNIQSVRETLPQVTEHSDQISMSKNESKSEDIGKKITYPKQGEFIGLDENGNMSLKKSNNTLIEKLVDYMDK